MGENVLRLENVTMQFGGVVAVNNLSMEINKGEIVALIGPNGAGKTPRSTSSPASTRPPTGRSPSTAGSLSATIPRAR